MLAAPQGDSSLANETYGFVGLGHQGSQIVRRCASAGRHLVVYDTQTDRAEQFRPAGMSVAGTLAELGRRVTVASVCVYSDEDVRTVVAGPGGLLETMRSGSLVVIHSTCSPRTCVDLAARARGRGITVLDAPVSNGAPDESGRQLVVLAGGDRRDVDRCAPVFELFGRTVVYTGDVGSAQLTKLVNNALFIVHRSAAIEALRAAGTLGLDPDGVRVALQECSANARSLPIPGGPPIGGHGGPPPDAFVALLTKDLNLLEASLADCLPGTEHLVATARRALATMLAPPAPLAPPTPAGFATAPADLTPAPRPIVTA
ncbi:6-phosphogluconate dehydrogenase NAD-binding [Parafrankia sp. EAN1pec]|uniref:NAD(P)-dependent oxidoreductase n=1 Tax=Parafrankia sp. (strain EAN1pec) TaxID=298653 RepID=UPI0000541515|nr:6-phosphogluconate dehydrogenase NAD-binding [Frankia sp. EAN1pec]